MSSRKLRVCNQFSQFQSIGNVPEEILIENIFMELPVISILQCRCVCKQWFRMLTDPDFIAVHYKQQFRCKKLLFGPCYSTDLPPELSLARSFRGSLIRDGVFFSVDAAGGSGGSAVRLPGFKPPVEFDLMRTLGHVNGIVCMEVRKKGIKYGSFSKSWHLLFGNPATGKYKILSEPVEYGNLLVGFGYDSVSDDYKLVIVGGRSRNPNIFSLKSNSWRCNVGKSDECKVLPNHRVGRKELEPHNVGCCLDNCIYWVTEEYNWIVRFDWKDEEFIVIPFPRKSKEGKYRLSIKVVEDVLYAISVCHRNGVVEMWSMSKEENSELWSKIMSVSITCCGRYFDIYPLCVMEDAKMLCCIEYSSGESYIRLDKRKHVLINAENNMVEDYVVKGISSDWLQHHIFEMQHSSYVDNLLSPIYS